MTRCHTNKGLFINDTIYLEEGVFSQKQTKHDREEGGIMKIITQHELVRKVATGNTNKKV